MVRHPQLAANSQKNWKNWMPYVDSPPPAGRGVLMPDVAPVVAACLHLSERAAADVIEKVCPVYRPAPGCRRIVYCGQTLVNITGDKRFG